jgi:hypothetical protein
MANIFRDISSFLTFTKHLQTVDTGNKDFVILRILRIVVNMGDNYFCTRLKNSFLHTRYITLEP